MRDKRLLHQWPHNGRDALDPQHAIYAVVQHLLALGLEDKVVKFVSWLGHYDGFETMLLPAAHPVANVRKVLFSHVLYKIPSPEPLLPQQLEDRWTQIVNDLLHLEFLAYPTYWSKGFLTDATRWWNPIEQSWMSFVDSRMPQEDFLGVWDTMRPLPDHNAIRDHLMQF